MIRSGLALVLLLASITTDNSELFPGRDISVPAEYFGLHLHRAASGTPWPAVPFASWRLWDSGVAWPQLEPEPRKWDFKLLDHYVQLAAEHDVEIMLTLGLTPSWASSRPEEASSYKRGNAAEPRDLADWRNYVGTVASHYKGVIRYYEIWNEPNVRGTFTGSPETMLQLARVAYETLKGVDPSITVVSPSATANAGADWLTKFVKAGGCQYSDVIGYHFYVTPDAPEAMLPLIRRVKNVLGSRGCEGKPLWNTESGWAGPKYFSSDSAASGYLIRAYLVNWLMGVDRFYWYAWDNHNWSTLETTARSGDEKTPVGNTYGVIRGWLLGSILQSCRRQESQIWVCQLTRESAKSWIVWSADGTQSFSIPKSWGAKSTWMWTGQSSVPGATVQVGATPIRLSESVP